MLLSRRTASVMSKSSSMILTKLAEFHYIANTAWHPFQEASCILTSRQYCFWELALSWFLSIILPSSVVWTGGELKHLGSVTHLSKPHQCDSLVLFCLGLMRLLLLRAHPSSVQNIIPQIMLSLGLNLWRDTSLASLSCFYDFSYWALWHSRIFV